MIRIQMVLDGDPKAIEEALNGDPQILRDLCRKEVELFDMYLRKVDPQFKDGLAKWECLVVEGYIYQKLKGHIDAQDRESNDSKERNDGPTTSD